MAAFIGQPKRVPLLLKLGLWISKRITGKDLLIGKLLYVYPKVAIGSAILESLVAHKDKDFISELNKNFNEREIVILASTAAQVNYWARLIQALGIPSTGFCESCNVQNNRTMS